MSREQIWLTVAAAVGAGAIGGVFFAFSAFVMPALERLPAAQGIAAMQSINLTAQRTALMTGMFGTALLCCALAFMAYRSWGEPQAWWWVAGCALYLVGPIGLTIVHHVPLNDALATVHAQAPGAAAQWQDYLHDWNPLNHLRAAGGIGAAAAFIVALLA
jgi:uncharacterized membrane protein